jgi:radical SAM family RiPP maturation amino acid epimerase
MSPATSNLKEEVNSYFGDFRSIYSNKSAEELYQLAHAKRFLERFQGDQGFRAAVLGGLLDLGEAAAACSCKIDVSSLRPVFHPEFVKERVNATVDTWPLTALWNSYCGSLLAFRNKLLRIGDTNGANPAFDKWRERQVNRAAFELGAAGLGIVHPPVAFELSSGCSVGCWFCGISAAKFGGNYSLKADGGREWAEIVEATQSVIGRGLSTGFCYWATEPLDNPEYLEFIRIYRDVVGITPQTTTSIPLRDEALTRAVLREWGESKAYPNRFSILTTQILKRVHERFTPEELLGVELVLQNGGSSNNKSHAGRARDLAGELSGGVARVKQSTVVAGTIACVTGFLINIVEKSIRLVSPTLPSEAWPDGYVVFDQASFGSAADLADQLNAMVARNMELRFAADRPVRLGTNVAYFEDGDELGFRSQNVRVAGRLLGAIGPALQDGSATPAEIVKSACRDGVDPFRVVALLGDARRSGLLERTERGHDGIGVSE